MPSNIVVPEVGESIVDARVARWLRQEGDLVAVGDPLVELETDKIDLEVAASQAGVLKRIDRKDGDDVKVGEVLGVIEDAAAGAGAPEAAAAPAQGPSDRDDTVPAEAASDAASQAGSASDARTAGEKTRATPTARNAAEDRAVDLSRVRGTGDAGRVMRRDVEQAATGGANGRSASGSEPAKAAQATDAVNGTPGQALSKSEPGKDAVPEPVKAKPAPPMAELPRRLSGDRTEERVRLSKRRATIARRLVEAQSTAAMLTTFNEADMSAVMAVRERHKQSFKERHGTGLGVASFFVKAATGALRAFPRINAEIQGDEMVLKHYYDIGVAVGASEGLVVPVLRDADRMSFAEIEKQIRDFAKRAEDGSLSLADLKGGTFTITNGGVFGSLLSTPILNPPQVAILGLHAIQQRPIAINGQVAVRPMMYMALTYDHRIVDGSEAVQFLVRIKQLIEDPAALLLD
jgi:2-oxoglutarate dehydrogenase E2 component (dihydrolipoamide succinyltransferase)